MTSSLGHSHRRTPTQSRARHTRDAILEATAQILGGSDAAVLPSTNRIAARAGVSIGTLYQYFDSREDIIRALCRQHRDEMLALLLLHAGPVAEAPVEDAVPAFVDAMIAAHATAPRLHLALLRELLNDGGELLAELRDPSHAFVLAWLERNRHRIRPRDLPAAAFLLTHTVEAAIHGQLIVDPARLGDGAWRTELVDLMLRYLLP